MNANIKAGNFTIPDLSKFNHFDFYHRLRYLRTKSSRNTVEEEILAESMAL
jgi:hypothetical protein